MNETDGERVKASNTIAESALQAWCCKAAMERGTHRTRGDAGNVYNLPRPILPRLSLVAYWDFMQMCHFRQVLRGYCFPFLSKSKYGFSAFDFLQIYFFLPFIFLCTFHFTQRRLWINIFRVLMCHNFLHFFTFLRHLDENDSHISKGKTPWRSQRKYNILK